MKLLFDQNLSHKLIVRLGDLYPDSAHVRNVGLQAADDASIWNCSKLHHFVFVTKDEDFHTRSMLLGQPPKVLWIRSGNCSTELVETLLRKCVDEIQRFEVDAVAGFLALI